MEVQGRVGRRFDLWRSRNHWHAPSRSTGFADAFHVAAINGGRHAAPLFAGQTVFASKC
jgi:2-methylfumaryl-CoA hydratase